MHIGGGNTAIRCSGLLEDAEVPVRLIEGSRDKVLNLVQLPRLLEAERDLLFGIRRGRKEKYAQQGDCKKNYVNLTSCYN